MLRLGVFRDGPFLPPREGGSASILGMARAMTSYASVFLFRCYRGWDDFNLYKREKFTTFFIKSEDYYSDRKLITDLIREYRINACLLDSSEAVNMQSQLFSQEMLVIWEVHNVDHVLLQRLGSPNQEINHAIREAVKAGKKADVILARSRKDKNDLIKIGIDAGKIRLYRGAIEVETFEFQALKPHTKNIVFMGNLYYGPNEDAVKRIQDYIIPQAAKYDNKLQFLFVGPHHPSLTLRLPGFAKNYKFLGEVDNLNEVFRQCQIGLCPVRAASGTRMKILNYLAAGLPTISTTLGIEGLDPTIKQFVMVEDDIEKYPKMIMSLLNNSPDRKRLLLARKLIEKKYSWNMEAKQIVKDIKNEIERN